MPCTRGARRDAAFAHGGHLFAAVNGISVAIYNAYTAENIGNLRGHNGKVRPPAAEGQPQRGCAGAASRLLYRRLLGEWESAAT
jgi:hypothetical protein